MIKFYCACFMIAAVCLAVHYMYCKIRDLDRTNSNFPAFIGAMFVSIGLVLCALKTVTFFNDFILYGISSLFGYFVDILKLVYIGFFGYILIMIYLEEKNEE